MDELPKVGTHLLDTLRQSLEIALPSFVLTNNLVLGPNSSPLDQVSGQVYFGREYEALPLRFIHRPGKGGARFISIETYDQNKLNVYWRK